MKRFKSYLAYFITLCIMTLGLVCIILDVYDKSDSFSLFKVLYTTGFVVVFFPAIDYWYFIVKRYLNIDSNE
jgi:hypothetical protein